MSNTCLPESKLIKACQVGMANLSFSCPKRLVVAVLLELKYLPQVPVSRKGLVIAVEVGMICFFQLSALT